MELNKKFKPSRLLFAMFLRRETISSFARRSEISKQAISKMCAGLLVPSKPTLLSIIDTLRLPKSFFVEDSIEVTEKDGTCIVKSGKDMTVVILKQTLTPTTNE